MMLSQRSGVVVSGRPGPRLILTFLRYLKPNSPTRLYCNTALIKNQGISDKKIRKNAKKSISPSAPRFGQKRSGKNPFATIILSRKNGLRHTGRTGPGPSGGTFFCDCFSSAEQDKTREEKEPPQKKAVFFSGIGVLRLDNLSQSAIFIVLNQDSRLFVRGFPRARAAPGVSLFFVMRSGRNVRRKQ